MGYGLVAVVKTMFEENYLGFLLITYPGIFSATIFGKIPSIITSGPLKVRVTRLQGGAYPDSKLELWATASLGVPSDGFCLLSIRRKILL